MSIISTNALTKKYRELAAVDSLDLHVDRGMIYGFLGLNGAGKTTTMRMLLGMINPTSGTYSLFENKYPQNRVWQKVGYMIESTHAYPDLTVKENLQVYYQYYRLKDRKVIARMIDRLKLGRYENVKSKFLSLGNLQRLGIAKALMHQPELLILDEPVNGLDPAGIVEVRELLQELAASGVTIFISSHLLGEVAKVAGKIGIIHQGKLIKEITATDLPLAVHKKLIIDTSDNPRMMQLLSSEIHRTQMNGRGEIELQDSNAILNRAEIASKIVAENVELRKLAPWEEDLESFFLRVIKEGEI